MTKSVTELLSIQDAVLYWQQCLAARASKNDMSVAGHMVNLAASDYFDDWYQKEGSPEFIEVFDLVASLEVPNGTTEIGNDEMRKAAWERVSHLLEVLDKKYFGEQSKK